jgi:hypothetical protein
MDATPEPEILAQGSALEGCQFIVRGVLLVAESLREDQQRARLADGKATGWYHPAPQREALHRTGTVNCA